MPVVVPHLHRLFQLEQVIHIFQAVQRPVKRGHRQLYGGFVRLVYDGCVAYFVHPELTYHTQHDLIDPRPPMGDYGLFQSDLHLVKALYPAIAEVHRVVRLERLRPPQHRALIPRDFYLAAILSCVLVKGKLDAHAGILLCKRHGDFWRVGKLSAVPGNLRRPKAYLVLRVHAIKGAVQHPAAPFQRDNLPWRCAVRNLGEVSCAAGGDHSRVIRCAGGYVLVQNSRFRHRTPLRGGAARPSGRSSPRSRPNSLRLHRPSPSPATRWCNTLHKQWWSGRLPLPA